MNSTTSPDPHDAAIDALYTLPLGEFTAARNALAKTLTGTDAARVKQLQKPVAIAWAINQLYWTARDTYDALMSAGQRLRAAQVATLEGTTADVPGAAAAHRAALSAATDAAAQLARAADVRTASDALSRILETLSLAAAPLSTPGRLVEAVQPAGLEALSGIVPVARSSAPPGPSPAPASAAPSRAPSATRLAQEQRAAREAARVSAEQNLRKAHTALSVAKEAEARAQALVDATRSQLTRAETTLLQARAESEAAASAVSTAETMLAQLSPR